LTNLSGFTIFLIMTVIWSTTAWSTKHRFCW